MGLTYFYKAAAISVENVCHVLVYTQQPVPQRVLHLFQRLPFYLSSATFSTSMEHGYHFKVCSNRLRVFCIFISVEIFGLPIPVCKFLEGTVLCCIYMQQYWHFM